MSSLKCIPSDRETHPKIQDAAQSSEPTRVRRNSRCHKIPPGSQSSNNKLEILNSNRWFIFAAYALCNGSDRRKSYGGNTPPFNNISFHINEGDKIALAARNGVGKAHCCAYWRAKETEDEGKLWINKEVNCCALNRTPIEEDTVLENIFIARTR